MQQTPASRPTRRLFAAFSSDLIYTARGRRIFYLLNPFALAGYRIELLRHPEFDSFGREGKMILALDGLTVVDQPPADSADCRYLFDLEDPRCKGHRWHQKIVVRFDVFASYAAAIGRGQPPIVVPWPIHPTHCGPDLPQRLSRARDNDKRVGVFFSGDMNGYRTRHIHYPRPKLTRSEVIDAAREALPRQTRLLGDDDAINQTFDQPHRDQFVLIDTSKTWVGDWLNRLSMADFFLGAPGIVMPICHNAVEAMAVGTVPIINYPEWFQPALEHGRNCLVFDDRRDLVAQLEAALTMDRDAVGRLRAGAIDYYRQHLDPLLFARAVEQRPEPTVTVLLLTEKYVRDHAARLNRHSFLVRSPGDTVDDLWLRLLGRLGINR